MAKGFSCLVTMILAIGCSAGHSETDARQDTDWPDSLQMDSIDVGGEPFDGALEEEGQLETAPDGGAEAPVEDAGDAAGDIETEADGWAGTPAPVLLVCAQGFVDCTGIEDVEVPYLRHGGWLRVDVGAPESFPTQLAVAVDASPVPCANTSCDFQVSTAEVDHLRIDALVRYGEGFGQSVGRSWVLPVFDCVIDPARPMCLRFGSWQPQEPVFEDDGLVLGHSVVQRPAGDFAAGLMIGPSKISTDCRVLLATGVEGQWARSTVNSWSETEDCGCSCASAQLAVGVQDDSVFLSYVTMLGDLLQSGLHVDRVQVESGMSEKIAFLPYSEDAACSCGYSTLGLSDVILDMSISILEANYIHILFYAMNAYYMIREVAGEWACETLQSAKDGLPWTISRGVGFAVASSRYLARFGGGIHAVMGNTYGVFYTQYDGVKWTDALFVDNMQIDYVWQAMNAISPGNGNSIYHAYLVGSDELAFGVRSIRDGKAEADEEEELHAALDNALAASGLGDASGRPWGLELATDSCARPHLVMPVHVADDKPWRFYEFSNLTGEWTGEWLAEISPGPYLEVYEVPNHDPFFFDNQGRQHLFYPTRPTADDPEGTPSRLMHWMRPCEVYLTE